MDTCKTYLVAGVMSGTSMDALDIGICEIKRNSLNISDVSIKLISLNSIKFIPEIKTLFAKLPKLSIGEVAKLNNLLGRFIGESVNLSITKCGRKLGDLNLIGSHGQTIYHHSGTTKQIKPTMQVGDGDIIATITGIPVVSDFRQKDISLSGEGAPITPYADIALFGSSTPTAIINLGGIANVSL